MVLTYDIQHSVDSILNTYKERDANRIGHDIKWIIEN